MADSTGLSIPDSTGHLGNLEAKSTEELQYLLHRQKMIYKNQKFVNKLPDKGEKLKKLIERIECILQQTEKVDKTADLFEKMAIDAEITSRNRSREVNEKENDNERVDDGVSISSCTEVMEDNNAENALTNMVNRKERSKQIWDDRTSNVPSDKSYVNNYAKVISRSEDLAKKHHKFIPGRTLKTKPQVTHQDEDMKEQTDVRENIRKLKYDECLEYKSDRKAKFTGAKDVSLDESIQLMQQQQQRNQELQTQNAAEKLAQRLGFKVGAFNPEGSMYTRYRDNTEADSGDEEDDDAVEQDYPE